MKKLAGLLIICTFTLGAAEFSANTQKNVQAALKEIIALGNAVDERGGNPALSIFKGMQRKLNRPIGMYGRLSINQLPSAALAYKILFHVSVDPEYIHLSQVVLGLKKEEQSAARRAVCLRGSYLIMDHVAACSKVKFNRDLEEGDKIFTNNTKLNPASSCDAGFLEAGLIALIGLQENL